MSDKPKFLTYKPTQTAIDLAKSTKPINVIFGCLGSGKSVLAFFHCLHRAMNMPVLKDTNIRKSRIAIIRSSFSRLKDTVIRTIQQWIPSSFIEIKGNGPMYATMKCRLHDGTILDWEIIFIAVDALSVDKLKSLDLTGYWISEFPEIDELVFETINTRIDRFPAKKDMSQVYEAYGVMEGNTGFSNRHWAWKYFVDESTRPSSIAMFRQPPALIYDVETDTYKDNPLAENAENHNSGYEYWHKMTRLNSRAFCKVYVEGEFMVLVDGRAVYENDYEDRVHYADMQLDYIPNIRIVCGIDGGLTPSAVFVQVAPNGTLNILSELITENMGFQQFAEEVLLPHIQNNYPRTPISFYCDTTMNNRHEVTGQSCIEIGKRYGLELQPSMSNKPTDRWNAVRYFLRRRGGFSLSSACPVLRDGFIGEYHFAKLNSRSSETIIKDKAEKNFASHPHDALQYACLALYRHMNGGRKRRRQEDYPIDVSWKDMM